MPDKMPQKHEHKKAGKTIKQRRAEKRAKQHPGLVEEPVGKLQKRRT